MLLIIRKIGDAFCIGPEIKIKIVAIKPEAKKVVLGIDASEHFKIEQIELDSTERK